MRIALIPFCLLAVFPAAAQILDFESPVYQADQALAGTDGWAVFRDADNTVAATFKILGEPGNKSVRCQTTHAGILYRDFPPVAGTLSLGWRWRATGDLVHLCLGVARKLDLASGLDPRALACIDPYATLEAQGGQAARASKENWVKQKWYYMRMVMDAEANTSILYIADSASREDERVAVPSMPMNDVGPLSRLVLMNAGGGSPLDLDDIAWEPVSTWIGGTDSNWSTAANWSGKTTPDAITRAVFDESSPKNCFLDKDALTGSITVAAGYMGTLDLGAATLSVPGKAEFTGGKYAWSAGQILLNGPGRQSLTGPDSLRKLPPVHHDGTGTLQLNGPLAAASFQQTHGTLDFNGFDMTVTGDLIFQNGNPASIANLDGRTLSAGGEARFEGSSKDTLLYLDAPPYAPSAAKGWTISVPKAGNLSARLAAVGKANAASATGLASKSTDAGGNSGWIFGYPPEITASPRDTAVPAGRTASFRVSVARGIPVTYQWLRNAAEIPAAADSIYTLAAAHRADSGAAFSCRVSSTEGAVTSAAGKLSVEFPAPGITPSPQAFTDSLTVKLSPPFTGSAVVYALNGSGYKPYLGPLVLRESTLVKAYAILGPDSSLIGSWSFPKTDKPLPIPTFPLPGTSVTLNPGSSQSLSEKYAFTGPAAGSPAVTLKVLPTDSLGPIQGFNGIQFAVRLSPTDDDAPFPKVAFSAPGGENRYLYRVEKAGKAAMVHFVSEGGGEIRAAGTYFLGVDTLPPRIELVSETFVGDSTKTVFAIHDNVSDLSLDLSRSDDMSRGFTGRSIGNPESLSVVLKSPPGPIRPFSLRLEASDGKQRISFPAEPGAAHFLARSGAGPARTPSAFRIGDDKSNPWDLIAFPLALDPPLTLDRLRRDNALPDLQAAVWSDSAGKYRFLKDAEPMVPGSSLWIGSLAGKLASIGFASLRTAPRLSEAAYRITLHKGWNQVADPTLATLYWPVSRTASPGYASSLLKGLHGYDAATGSYAHSDSLEPWRGYFAFYKGDRDTVVELRFQPLPSPPLGKAGFAGPAPAGSGAEGIAIRLGLDHAQVSLGAASFASDGIGIEDESRPPAFGNRAPRLATLRAGRSLETDVLHWKPGSGYAWKVIAGLPVGNAKDTSGSAPDARIRIEELSLPAGYSAWAVSRRRGLRFRLDGEGIPLAADFTDSLDVFAGPAAELDARLAAIPLTPGAFNASVSAVAGRISLDLRLPRAARVRWSLWTLDGRNLETGNQTLPEGIYRLRAGGGRNLPAGEYALRLEWSAQGAGEGPASGRLNRRIALP